MHTTLRFIALLPTIFASVANCQQKITETPPGQNGRIQGSALFDGTSLTDWQPTRFGGEGAVSIQQGSISLGMGSPLTGIHWTASKPLPTLDYELHVEARRVDGNDFFCGLTFPYKDSHCSLILGGWGGGLVGLSSLDGRDASENETTQFLRFEQGRWYRIRLRVRENLIETWLDERKIVDCDVSRRTVSTRPEVILSKPLGFASYETKAEIRAIKLDRLDENR